MLKDPIPQHPKSLNFLRRSTFYWKSHSYDVQQALKNKSTR